MKCLFFSVLLGHQVPKWVGPSSQKSILTCLLLFKNQVVKYPEDLPTNAEVTAQKSSVNRQQQHHTIIPLQFFCSCLKNRHYLK